MQRKARRRARRSGHACQWTRCGRQRWISGKSGRPLVTNGVPGWAAPSGARNARQPASRSVPLVDEARSLIRTSRASVVAPNHQVGHAVLGGGPVRDRVDELASNTCAPRCWIHPHGDELHPFLFDELPADDTDHRRAFVGQQSERDVGQARRPALSGGVDPVVIARAEGCGSFGKRRQSHRPKRLPIVSPDLRNLHQPDVSKCRDVRTSSIRRFLAF